MTTSYNVIEKKRPILYISSHAHPLFPMTGNPADNSDTLLNIHLPNESGSDVFRQAYKKHVFSKLASFEPDLLLLSAGFDAHKDDPLGTLNLNEDDFTWVTQQLRQSVNCPILSILEGGYNTPILKKCVEAHLKSL